MKKLLSGFLRPPIRVIIIADLIAMPLTIIALSVLSEKNPVSYIAYLLSAWALTVTVISFRKIVRRAKELVRGDEVRVIAGFRRLMRKNRYTARYLESRAFRAEVGLYRGLILNLFYAAFKLVTGIRDGSVWLISIGIYYFAFAAARFMLMKDYRVRQTGSDSRRRLYEYTTYRRCGSMMMLLNLTMTGMSVQMIWQNRVSSFSRTAAIISAAYTFYYFISAIVNVVRFRRSDNAILLAAKDLAMTGAVMSMFSLQNSMIHAFGGDDQRFRLIMNSVTGGFAMVTVIAIATFMIINGTRKIQQYRNEE